MYNRQQNFLHITSPNVYENLRRIFVVASATDDNPVFFNGMSIGVPAPLTQPAQMFQNFFADSRACITLPPEYIGWADPTDEHMETYLLTCQAPDRMHLPTPAEQQQVPYAVSLVRRPCHTATNLLKVG